MNNNYGIAQQATAASFAYVKEERDRYLAAMVIGALAAFESSLNARMFFWLSPASPHASPT